MIFRYSINPSSHGREYPPLLGEVFAHIFLKIIYIVDDRKPVIGYAISIAVKSLFSKIYLDTRKEPEKWLR